MYNIKFQAELNSLAQEWGCSLRDAALRVCQQYYVEKGYSMEHAKGYAGNEDDKIIRVFDIIQEERKKGE